MTKYKLSALILAGGKSSRFGDGNKLLAEIDGVPVIRHTLEKFEDLHEIVLVAPPALIHEFDRAAQNENIVLVAGGDSRTQSVINGLGAVTGDLVLIHDGARPFVSKNLISRCICDVLQFGSSITAVKTTDTIAETSGDKITSVLARNSLYNIQTPQGFFTPDIKKAYQNIDKVYPDDSSVFLTVALPHITEGEYTNRKITTKSDLDFFDKTDHLSAQKQQRIGSAFDTHRLVPNRPLMLGGVQIPFEKGLLGHSDADVLLHTAMGAILNALGLKDIGTYFPDTDPDYKDANSADLLAAVMLILKSKGFALANASFTVIAEQPKLAPYIDQIKQSLSCLLSLPAHKIGLGATTAEKLGDIGKGDSMACLGYVLVVES